MCGDPLLDVQVPGVEPAGAEGLADGLLEVRPGRGDRDAHHQGHGCAGALQGHPGPRTRVSERNSGAGQRNAPNHGFGFSGGRHGVQESEQVGEALLWQGR